MRGIKYIDNFVENHLVVFDEIVTNTAWDDRMHTRKTASFGIAYNYSQMSYPYQDFTEGGFSSQ